VFQIIYILNSIFFQIYFSRKSRLQCALCFLFLAFVPRLFTSSRIVFVSVLPEIKIDELGKRQEIRDKKHNCR